MDGLHANQKKILEFLLDHAEGATLEQISDHLGVTKTAAKEHVIKLENQELLTYHDTRGNVGRPKRRYQLSPAGHERFPRQYSWLSNVLLEFLAQDMGSKAVGQMMKNVANRVSLTMMERFRNKKSTTDLLLEISTALNELGYRTSVKQSDLRKGAIIEANNCVYHTVAKEHPELCRFDVQFIHNASGGMNVKLESCIARGGSVCRFCITRSTKSIGSIEPA